MYLSKTSDGVHETTNQTFAHGSGSSNNKRQNLQVFGNQQNRGDSSLQPTSVTMSDNTAGQVAVALELLEVLAHVAGHPRVVSSQSGNIVPIFLGGKNGDQSVVLGTTTKSTSSRIEDTLSYRSFRRVQARVVFSRGSEIGHLRVTLSLRLVGIVVDEKVPLDGVISARIGVQSWNLDLSVGTVILTSVNEQDAIASKSKTSCKRGTTRTRSDDDVLVSRIGYGSFRRIVVTIRRKLWIIGQLWPRPLEPVFLSV